MIQLLSATPIPSLKIKKKRHISYRYLYIYIYIYVSRIYMDIENGRLFMKLFSSPQAEELKDRNVP